MTSKRRQLLACAPSRSGNIPIPLRARALPGEASVAAKQSSEALTISPSAFAVESVKRVRIGRNACCATTDVVCVARSLPPLALFSGGAEALAHDLEKCNACCSDDILRAT